MLKHILGILILDVLFCYFFQPYPVYAPILCLVLAGLTWWLAIEDLRTRLVDLRIVGLFFLTGLCIRPDLIVSALFFGMFWLLFSLVMHEATSKITDTMSRGEHYISTQNCTEDTAPPYAPCLVFGLVIALSIYALFPALFTELGSIGNSISFDDLSVAQAALYFYGVYTFIAIIGMLAIALFCLYRRKQKALKAGKAVLYRGIGEGDL